METVPLVTATPKPVDRSVIDKLAKCRSTMVNFSAEVLQEWNEYFEMLEEIRQDPYPTIAYVTPKALAELAEPTKQGLVLVEKRRSQLRLTSVLGVQNRETLVASDRATATAWSHNQENMRSTPRIQRVPVAHQSCEGKKDVWRFDGNNVHEHHTSILLLECLKHENTKKFMNFSGDSSGNSNRVNLNGVVAPPLAEEEPPSKRRRRSTQERESDRGASSTPIASPPHEPPGESLLLISILTTHRKRR